MVKRSTIFSSMAFLPTLALAAVPKNTHDYHMARQSLIFQNSAKSFDSSTELTPLEQEVDKKLVSMRDAYITQSKKDGTFAPETYFHTWDLDKIRSDPTFQFLDGLPKGGNLHTHSESSGSVDWLITEGLAMEGAHVYWPDAPSTSTEKARKGTIAFYKEGDAPAGYLPAASLVSQEGFAAELRGLLTSNEKCLDTDSGGAWKVFQGIFGRLGPAMSHRPLYLRYMHNSFEENLKNGIQHVELRALLGAEGLGSLTDLDGLVCEGRCVVETYQEAFEAFKSSSPAHANFTFKLILSNSRAAEPKKHVEDLGVIVELRKEFPDFVVGFDSVSEEDPNHRTLDYVEAFLNANEELSKSGLTLPLYLHDGESQDRNNTNMIDAVLLECPRIGHGFNDAFFFPAVREELKRKGMALEICPISNQVLRYVGSLESHPGAALAFDGVQIVIANDDPGVFGYTGVTLDWWGVTMAWYLDLRSLKTIAKNSLLFSALEGTEKATAIEHWEQQWNAYMALYAEKAMLI